MTKSSSTKLKYCVIAATILFVAAHLLWEHLNGGILSHHLMHHSDYPSISNWWGLLILPFLAWLSTLRIEKRVTLQPSDAPVRAKILRGALFGFFGMLVLSLVQSLSFSVGYESVAIYLSLGLVLVGLFLPIYRAECIFGYVFGSIVFTGAIIPLIGILLIAGISWLSHVCIKPLVFRVIREKFR
ncbi:hypothetical protein ORJ04_19640 [Rheinheimera baltica]|uniref:Tripartite tricarboxylate transporter TctB family protein n=1 Tax=Rheinheimera baltica TaxID=67576 RepID=A0ABT9I453_9GAMM|nr:hypothetical protein [Rheinheimera baltica]MDP5138164.1 hypothetical protein [Rheinheimera baltica]